MEQRNTFPHHLYRKTIKMNGKSVHIPHTTHKAAAERENVIKLGESNQGIFEKRHKISQNLPFFNGIHNYKQCCCAEKVFSLFSTIINQNNSHSHFSSFTK